ncbi:class II D-tagatose-bisphosphate aldolase non-catalytic subunit [Caldicellulosiruptor acetigenus]|uniref:class II D-tagatose-bisphosphate aldolase non-catalytic subunit n=1 Tax=Caldicellulosiruptor acetigenus TaxID=301953 RepID=UPI0004036E0A|nr:class II D-tagatose-bisphosphate aldolase, non-catalytic subunit [Caldicellulosiruptor acetigenus]WAM36852.1 class II D-tagatose-bisphosphate aldolase, non-catalytic subunit [Caldicellulosiruptor acetigenus]
MSPQNLLLDLFKNREKGFKGIISVCSSNEIVLEAVLKRMKDTNLPIIIESTANQVNQFGGYSGLTPSQFKKKVIKIAQKVDFPPDRIILGGDHLGPFVWRDQEPEIAMEYAKQMIKEYIKAGFTKIHIDTSMPLKGENSIDDEIIAKRTAVLCRIAEECFEKISINNTHITRPVYVIGADVPPPGGESSICQTITTKEELERSLEYFKEAFKKEGIEHIFDYVVAVVANFGVEFGSDEIVDFDMEKVRPLKELLGKYNIVFEGHSTDYQTKENLKRMVECGIVILKVGPALTFALREALVALSHIEEEIYCNEKEKLSRFREVLLNTMLTCKDHWSKYFDENDKLIKLKLLYSYLDRWRYYFENESVKSAVYSLIGNLENVKIPPWLISQYFPYQYQKMRKKDLKNGATELILDKIGEVIDSYVYAVKK